MVREPKEYKDEFDYVKIRSLQRFNIDKRDWTCDLNFPLEEGEEAIVARNGKGMQFFFDNGFFEVLDHEPLDDIDRSSDSAPEENDEVQCDECGGWFKNERGLKQHERQSHDEAE